MVDRRHLPPPPPASELRLDPLRNEWVAVAAHRQDRTFLPPSDQCPLCPSTPGHASEIPADSYDVVVFENRFPSFSDRVAPVSGLSAAGVEQAPPGPGLESASLGSPCGPEDTLPGFGRRVVVCFTADHHAAFARLPQRRVRTVVDLWVDRTGELSALPGVEQVYCFENRGEEIGVTLHHPHGQIYAFPFVTPRTRRMLDSARAYAAAHHGANLFAAVLDRERSAGVRVARPAQQPRRPQHRVLPV